MATTEPTYILTGTHLGESSKAVRFSFHTIKENATGKDISHYDPPETHWFPLSQVTTINRGAIGEDDYIIAKRWILIQKEILK